MQYYSYTYAFENAHDGGIARNDPLEPERYLVPAKAATTAPGLDKDGFAQVWRPKNAANWPYSDLPLDVAASGEDGDWLYVEDHRQTMASDGTLSGGTQYWLPADGDKNGSQARYMTALGPLPNGAVTIEPAATTAELLGRLRSGRDYKLVGTDKYLVPDYPISESDLALVKIYRAALRDLPDQPGAPWDGGGELTPWPELPSVG